MLDNPALEGLELDVITEELKKATMGSGPAHTSVAGPAGGKCEKKLQVASNSPAAASLGRRLRKDWRSFTRSTMMSPMNSPGPLSISPGMNSMISPAMLTINRLRRLDSASPLRLTSSNYVVWDSISPAVSPKHCSYACLVSSPIPEDPVSPAEKFPGEEGAAPVRLSPSAETPPPLPWNGPTGQRPPSPLSALRDLLDSFESPDDGIKHDAEIFFFDVLGTRTVHRAMVLAKALKCRESTTSQRSMAARLLRLVLVGTGPTPVAEDWADLRDEEREEIKAAALACLQVESNPDFQDSACTLIGDIAWMEIEEKGVKGWPQAIEYVIKCASASAHESGDELACLGLRLLGSLGEIMMTCAAPTGAGARAIARLVRLGLAPSSSSQLQSLTVRAMGALLLGTADEKGDLKVAISMLPSLMMGAVHCLLAQCAAEGNRGGSSAIAVEQDACAALEDVADMARGCISFFLPHAAEMLREMASVITQCSQLMSVRVRALEVAVVFAESSDNMVDDLAQNYVETFVPACFNLILQEDEGGAWNEETHGTSDSSVRPTVFEALRRVAVQNIHPAFVPECLKLVQMCCSRKSPMETQLTGLAALRHLLPAFTALSTNALLAKWLNECLDGILQLANAGSISRGIRFNCEVLDTLSVIFQQRSLWSHDIHSKMVPIVLDGMNHKCVAIVRNSALAAAHSFLQNAPLEVSKLHAVDMVTCTLADMEEDGGATDRAMAVLSLGVARAGDKSTYLYDMAMQPLLGVLKCSEEIVVQKRLQRLRAQALKCATEIAAAMGDNVSFDDAETLIAALECMNRKAASGDPVRKLFPLAWGNICRALGDDFGPFVGHVQPLISATLRQLSHSADVSVANGPGNRTFLAIEPPSLMTPAMREMASMCMLCATIAPCLQWNSSHYAMGFLSDLLLIASRPLDAQVSKEVTSALISLIKACVQAVVEGDLDEQDVGSAHARVFDCSIGYMQSASSITLCLQWSCVAHACQVTMKALPNYPDQAEKVAELVNAAISLVDVERMSCRGPPSPQVVQLLESVSCILREAIKNSTLDAISVLEQSEAFAWLFFAAAPGQPKSDTRFMAMCLLSDLVQYAFGHDAVVNRAPSFVSMSKGVYSECSLKNVLGQMAVRCLSFSLVNLPEGCVGDLAEVRGILLECIRDAGPQLRQARGQDISIPWRLAGVTNRATWAVGDLLQRCPGDFNYCEAFDLWLNCLPIWNDARLLRATIQQLRKVVSNPSNRKLFEGDRTPSPTSQVMIVLADAAGCDPLADKDIAAILTIMEDGEASVSSEQGGEAWSKLTEEQQGALISAVKCCRNPKG